MTPAMHDENHYHHVVWQLPSADLQAWQAAAVAVHRLFDAVFSAKIRLGVQPDVFVLLDAVPLPEPTLSLSACYQQIVAASGGSPDVPQPGEHLIVCGDAVDCTMLTRWQPRSGLLLQPSAEQGRVNVTYLYKRGVFHDPAFADLLQRALYGLAQLVRQGVTNTADVTAAIRRVLAAPTPAPQHREPVRELFIARFSAIVAQTPDRLAVVAGDERITYAQLARMTDHLADGWREYRLHKGDRIMIIAPRGAALVATVVAAFKAGLAVCLIDPRQPDAWVETCCRLVNPALLVNLSGRTLAPPGVRVTTRVDLVTQSQAPQLCKDVFSVDDCAIITLTSGTTREPKAVMGRYRSLSHFFDWMNARLGPMADAAFAMCSSIGHDPLQRDIMTPLYVGGHIVIPGEQDLNEPHRLSRWLAENRIEYVCLNAALVPWLASSTPLTQLRALFCVGGALTRSQAVMLRHIAPGAQIVNLYGATETQRAVGFFVLPDDPQGCAALPDVVPLGRGMEEVDLLVRDLTRPALALPYQTGEIAIRSPCIALGYVGDEALTRQKFITDVAPGVQDIPTYLTGDVGYVSLHYGVIFSGRMDDQYKVSGYRVELSAIDDMCRQHPQIANAATLVIDVAGLPTLVACLVPRGTISGDERAEVRQWLAQRLPHYLVPHRICVLPELPLTLNRKVDMRALAGLVDAEMASHQAGMTVGTTRSQLVATFIERHTGQRQPRRDVPLVELGIDSLRFLALASQLTREGASSDGLHHRMTLSELDAALSKRGGAASEHRSPGTPPAAARAEWAQYHPRDLLGPALDVTETRITFARGMLDHCCSNSYLGLAGHPTLRAQIAHFIQRGEALGAHGSAELNGFTTWHEQLGTSLREIYRCDAVLLYGSGYLANVSAIAAVVSADDHLFVDESCHQSLIDGCRLSGASISVYRHNNIDDLQQLLSTTPRRISAVWAIVSEGVFSIEGDVLELPAIHALARQFDCRLIVDEACSLGLLGSDGAGVESYFGMPGAIDIRTGTLAKALASGGGYVTCRHDDVMRLRFQRGASFSTSLSPLNACIALQSAKVLQQEGRALKARLDRNTTLWRESLNALGFDTGRSSTAIVPLLCSDPDAVAGLFRRALDAEVYALPLSPAWSKRVHALRTSVTSAHEPERLRDIAARLARHGGLY